jgi:hypothetical protein
VGAGQEAVDRTGGCGQGRRAKLRHGAPMGNGACGVSFGACGVSFGAWGARNGAHFLRRTFFNDYGKTKLPT